MRNGNNNLPTDNRWYTIFRILLGHEVDAPLPEKPGTNDEDLDDSNFFAPGNEYLYTPLARGELTEDVGYLQGRYFGFASTGQMILLPQDTCQGDHVYLLYGIKLPFVLRSCGNERYQIIGACYVQEKIDWDEFEHAPEELTWITLQ